MPAHCTRGMTLVETLIALSIFIVIMIAVSTFEVNVFSYQRSISGSLTTSQDAQVILKTILKEVRSAAPSANGSYPIINAATNTLSFFSDSNTDGIQDQITYSLIGNTIYRALIKPTGSPYVYNVANQSTTTLVTNVRNSSSTPAFEYFDESYTGSSQSLAQPVTVTSIHVIKVNLTLDVDPNRSPLPVTFSGEMTLRNLKTNL